MAVSSSNKRKLAKTAVFVQCPEWKSAIYKNLNKGHYLCLLNVLSLNGYEYQENERWTASPSADLSYHLMATTSKQCANIQVIRRVKI